MLTLSASGLTSIGALTILPIVLRSLCGIVMILALCCAIGLHWIALQSFAWTTMLIENSKHAPLCHAIAKTFDGGHPCSLCHAVSKGKSSEEKSDFRPAAPKIDLICASRAIRLLPPFVPFEYVTSNCYSFDFGHSPPVPPPRSSLS